MFCAAVPSWQCPPFLVFNSTNSVLLPFFAQRRSSIFYWTKKKIYIFLLNKEYLHFVIEKKDIHFLLKKEDQIFSLKKRRSTIFYWKKKIYIFYLKKNIYIFVIEKEKFYIFYWKKRSRNTWTFPAGSNALNVGQLKQIAKVIVATKQQKRILLILAKK